MPNLTTTDVSLWLSPWSAQLAAFALVLCRVGGLLAVGLLLGRAILPWQVRLGLAIALSLLLAPLVDGTAVPSLDVASGTQGALMEFGIGFLLGCGSLLVLWAVPLAGHLLDQQTEQAASNEEAEQDGSPQTRWLSLWVVACFLLNSPVNGHVRLVTILADSFRTWPLGHVGGELFQASTAALLLQHAGRLAREVLARALATLV